MDKNYRVSVVMPVKDAEQTIEASVNSILDQTLSDFEIIIVDDGSTDGTRLKLEQFSNADSRLKIFTNNGQGISDGLNTGIEQASSPLIARMDADDLAVSTRLKLQFDAFEKNNDLVLLGTFFYTFESDISISKPVTLPTDNGRIRELIQVHPALCHPTIMFRKECIQEIGGYRKVFEGAEDHDLYLRFQHLGEISVLPEYLLYYRVHPEQFSFSQKAKGYRASVAAVHCRNQTDEIGVDPFDSGKSVEQLVIEFLEKVLKRKELLSKRYLKLCIRAILGLSTLPESQKLVIGIRKKLALRLIKSHQISRAISFWRSTRKSKWLTQ